MCVSLSEDTDAVFGGWLDIGKWPCFKLSVGGWNF